MNPDSPAGDGDGDAHDGDVAGATDHERATADGDGEEAAGATGGEEVVVRRFEPGDRDAVLALHRRALSDAGTDPSDVPGIDDLRAVRESYLESGGAFFVAETGGEIVAMGGLRVEGVRPGADAAVGELLRMRVAPTRQREGLGTAVLRRLEATARERGLDRLTLTTARRQTAATEFYPANGYEAVGRESHGEYDLVRFEKDLD